MTFRRRSAGSSRIRFSWYIVTAAMLSSGPPNCLRVCMTWTPMTDDNGRRPRKPFHPSLSSPASWSNVSAAGCLAEPKPRHQGLEQDGRHQGERECDRRDCAGPSRKPGRKARPRSRSVRLVPERSGSSANQYGAQDEAARPLRRSRAHGHSRRSRRHRRVVGRHDAPRQVQVLPVSRRLVRG